MRYLLFIPVLLGWLGNCSSSFALTPIKASSKSQHIVLVGAKIYPSPVAEPILNGVVRVRNGKIISVGRKEEIRIPRNSTVIDCAGLTVMAGFWNSHVHFIRPEWSNAADLPASQLNEQLRRMLLGYGFTSVFETATFNFENTEIIRQRIGAGEVVGPRILTTGPPIFSKNGTPFYIEPLLRELKLAPSAYEVDTRQKAVKTVKDAIGRGADAVKIFTAAPADNGQTVVMPPEIVKAVTAQAHRLGKPVFAHPQNREGMIAAIDGGIDILAHTAPNAGEWDMALILKMKRANIAVIPTLSLMQFEETDSQEGERVSAIAVNQLKAYLRADGQILFGTDAGYITEYDPTKEYLLMARAGMSFRQILASLTTSPAKRFGLSKHSGKIARGMEADLVLVGGDPESDIGNLAKVRYVMRAGRIVYRSNPAAKKLLRRINNLRAVQLPALAERDR
jgi:imidazolonepropionase-like amidohydrolase